MIAHRDLSVISNQFLKQNGGRRIPDQTMLDYALSWFLSELTIHGFGEGTAFKVGSLSEGAISASIGCWRT